MQRQRQKLYISVASAVRTQERTFASKKVNCIIVLGPSDPWESKAFQKFILVKWRILYNLLFCLARLADKSH